MKYTPYHFVIGLNARENKASIKSKVVLWKDYAGFSIWFYLKKFRVRVGIADSDQPELITFPEIGNDVSALMTITTIAQCQMKKIRSDRFKL